MTLLKANRVGDNSRRPRIRENAKEVTANLYNDLVKKFNSVVNFVNDSELGRSETVVRSANKGINNDTTLQADGELEFPLLAGESWTFDFRLFATEAGLSPDIKFRLGAFDGLTGTIIYEIREDLGNNTQVLSDFVTESAPVALTGSTRVVRINGGITAATSGTLKLEWAQGLSSANDTVVAANSTMVATRV